jgi:hypothetical protein
MGATVAKGSAARVDESGIKGAQRLISRIEPLHSTRAEVLKEDINLWDEAMEHTLASGTFEIDDDVAFVPVQGFIEGIYRGARTSLHGAARPVGGIRPFDLDNIGAPVGERCGSAGSLVDHGEFEDTNPFQG